MRPFHRSRPHSLRASAVVTGAGGGLGRAFSRELARRGGRVVCADRDEAGAVETARLVRDIDGGDALAVTCDVTDLAAVRDLADASGAFFGGPPTLVVNNAGIGAGGPVIGGPDDDLADWHATHDVNFWGVVHGCHVFVPLLRAAGTGGLITVASAAAFAAAPRMGAYSTSKAAVLALSETLAAETAGSGVTVSVLCPTFVRTGILTAGRIDPATSDLATRIMAANGRAPETVVRRALDAHDRGRLHVLPQFEGRLTWATKRAAPGLHTRGAGLGARLATRMLDRRTG